jgi:hypothetical protein
VKKYQRKYNVWVKSLSPFGAAGSLKLAGENPVAVNSFAVVSDLISTASDLVGDSK